MDDTLIKSLQNSKNFPHEVYQFEVIQTHISWVLLTGNFAYKIKKPVNFGFCDFTTLEKRKHFCELEVELNKRLAPDLYEGVMAITGTPHSPKVDGEGPIIEYAIKMRQFDQTQLLSTIHQTEGLSKALLNSLAQQCAQFHAHAQSVPNTQPFGSPKQVFEPMLDNFRDLNQLAPSRIYADQIEEIAVWAKSEFQKLEPLLTDRKANDYIKAAHGDLHLGNMVLIQGMPVVFDCIEFNDEFRFIDTISDMSFLAMDLEDKGYNDLAHYFCNQYFEATGDYQGIPLLRFYKSYRAMIRAKVMALTIDGSDSGEAAKNEMQKNLESFIKLAQRYKSEDTPSLTITFGPSGSGKSYYTERVLIEQKAYRLRSDVIRKQLAGLNPYEACPHEVESSLYSSELTKQVYQHLADKARLLLTANIPVIIDATCLKAWQRNLFYNISQALNVPFKILKFDHSEALLKSRISQREKTDKISDANRDVLAKQLDWLEPLSAVESQYVDLIQEHS